MGEVASDRSILSGVQRLLQPRSVAIVGASATPGALGTSVISNLERMRFAGDIFLINPSRDTVGARRCLKSVEEMPIGVDVAVLAIPRNAVLDTIRSLALRKVGGAIIFSSGFAEGGESGLADQHEIARIAADAGMIIEGPNCLGLVNYVDGVALTFVETPAIALGPRAGVAIVSQSGAMAAVISVMLTSKELGISYSISTGNEAVSGVEDYLEYLLQDSHTQAIALVVEQFRQPGRFLDLARRAYKTGKSIVLLHPGRSRAARESAATHTGALAGDHAVMCSRVGREGVLLPDTLEEFVDVLDVMMRCRTRPRGGAGVLTESGAFKALTLDLCEEIGLSLPLLTEASARLLRSALPEFVPVSNPVDLTAQGLADPNLYRLALAALLQDAGFGCIILVIIQTDARTCAIKLPTIIDAIRTLAPKKPIILAGLDEGAQVPHEYIAQLRALHVPYFPSPERALRSIARISAMSGRGTQHNGPGVRQPRLDLSGGGVICEYRAKEQLKLLGIRFPPGRIARTLDDAMRIAAKLGYPIALKAQSGELPHKSDVGGVVLNVQDANSIAAAWDRLQENIARNRPGLELDGVLVESMSPSGMELIIGGRNDPQWGPIVLAGFGGVQAEVLNDARLMAPDLSIEEIIRELYMLRSGELLRGFRGSPALDVDAVAHIIAQVGALLAAEPSIQEIDLNPVMVYPRGSGAIALDALIVASVSGGTNQTEA